TVKIGAPLAHLRAAGAEFFRRRVTHEVLGTPQLRPKPNRNAYVIPLPRRGAAQHRVGMSAPYAVQPAGRRTNAELAERFPGRTEEEIVRRTGIESRDCLEPGETALTIGIAAARRALAQEGLLLSDLSAIVCSTTTPIATTPSMACRVLHAL